MPELTFCPAVSRRGWHCETAVHPGHVHYTWRNGWLTSWMALPGEDERWRNEASSGGVLDEAPPALRVVELPLVPDPIPD